MWEARRRVGTVAPKVLRLEAAIKDGLERGDELRYAGKERNTFAARASGRAYTPEAILDAVREKYTSIARVPAGTVAMATMAAAADEATRSAC